MTKEEENKAMIDRIKHDLDMYTKKYDMDLQSEKQIQVENTNSINMPNQIHENEQVIELQSEYKKNIEYLGQLS